MIVPRICSCSSVPGQKHALICLLIMYMCVEKCDLHSSFLFDALPVIMLYPKRTFPALILTQRYLCDSPRQPQPCLTMPNCALLRLLLMAVALHVWHEAQNPYCYLLLHSTCSYSLICPPSLSTVDTSCECPCLVHKSAPQLLRLNESLLRSSIIDINVPLRCVRAPQALYISLWQAQHSCPMNPSYAEMECSHAQPLGCPHSTAQLRFADMHANECSLLHVCSLILMLW